MMVTHFTCIFCQKPIFVQSVNNVRDDLAKFENHMVENHEALYETELLFWACLAGEEDRGDISSAKIKRNPTDKSKEIGNEATKDKGQKEGESGKGGEGEKEESKELEQAEGQKRLETLAKETGVASQK